MTSPLTTGATCWARAREGAAVAAKIQAVAMMMWLVPLRIPRRIGVTCINASVMTPELTPDFGDKAADGADVNEPRTKPRFLLTARQRARAQTSCPPHTLATRSWSFVMRPWYS